MNILRSVSLADITNDNHMCIVDLQDDTNLDKNIKYFDARPLIAGERVPVYLNIDHNCDQVQFFLSEENNHTTAIYFVVRNATIPILKRRMHLLTMFYNHLISYKLLVDDDYINFPDLVAAIVALCVCNYNCPINCIDNRDFPNI